MSKKMVTHWLIQVPDSLRPKFAKSGKTYYIVIGTDSGDATKNWRHAMIGNYSFRHAQERHHLLSNPDFKAEAVVVNNRDKCLSDGRTFRTETKPPKYVSEFVSEKLGLSYYERKDKDGKVNWRTPKDWCVISTNDDNLSTEEVAEIIKKFRSMGIHAEKLTSHIQVKFSVYERKFRFNQRDAINKCLAAIENTMMEAVRARLNAADLLKENGFKRHKHVYDITSGETVNDVVR